MEVQNLAGGGVNRLNFLDPKRQPRSAFLFVFVFVHLFVFFVFAIIVTVLDSYALDIGENAACDLYYITLTHFTRSLSI